MMTVDQSDHAFCATPPRCHQHEYIVASMQTPLHRQPNHLESSHSRTRWHQVALQCAELAPCASGTPTMALFSDRSSAAFARATRKRAIHRHRDEVRSRNPAHFNAAFMPGFCRLPSRRRSERLKTYVLSPHLR